MISSFKCADTAELFHSCRNKRFANIAKAALRKLALLHAANNINFLRVPPGNRLEALKGDREGQYSIRINDQWRICFKWDEATNNADDVEIVDYH